MTDPVDSQRSVKQGKTRSTDEMATILACARATSQANAATLFGVAARTITRWEAAIRAGRLQDVAKLVREKEAAEARKRSDKLDAAYETALTKLEAKLEDATVDQLINATKMLGELRITRDALRDDELDRLDGAGEGAAEAEGPASRGAADTGAESGGGDQAGAGLRSGPIH